VTAPPASGGAFGGSAFGGSEAVVESPAHLVGYSDCATVALIVALRRSELVRRLVFVAGVFHHRGWTAGVTDPDNEPPKLRASGLAGAARPGGLAKLRPMMTTVEPMTARGAHYTALLETIDHQGATKLHAREREQLLEAADALLFGEPANRRLLRSAEELIESLEASERWSAESCDQLREHLYGCDAAAGIA
jgi:pimeloyl-ACP methyl ester carboxylesterase